MTSYKKPKNFDYENYENFSNHILLCHYNFYLNLLKKII